MSDTTPPLATDRANIIVSRLRELSLQTAGWDNYTDRAIIADTAGEIAELWQELDKWLRCGGTLPVAWQGGVAGPGEQVDISGTTDKGLLCRRCQAAQYDAPKREPLL